MTEVDLDLRAVEEELPDVDEDDERAGDTRLSDRVLLDVLDGSTDPEEWVELVTAGNVLVLSVDGDLNRLAAGFARDVREFGGELVHFRGFLVITPPGIEIDNDRLAE